MENQNSTLMICNYNKNRGGSIGSRNMEVKGGQQMSTPGPPALKILVSVQRMHLTHVCQAPDPRVGGGRVSPPKGSESSHQDNEWAENVSHAMKLMRVRHK